MIKYSFINIIYFRYQRLLHRNLIYLATVADATNQGAGMGGPPGPGSGGGSGPPNITLPMPNVSTSRLSVKKC